MVCVISQMEDLSRSRSHTLNVVVCKMKLLLLQSINRKLYVGYQIVAFRITFKVIHLLQAFS